MSEGSNELHACSKQAYEDSRADGMDEEQREEERGREEAEGVRLRQCVQADSISDQENQIITRSLSLSLSRWVQSQLTDQI